MSKTQESLIRSWYESKKEGRCASILATANEVQTGGGCEVAQRMADGFVMVNTDVLSISYRGGNIFASAMNAIGNRAIPVSFQALAKAGVPKNELRVIYKSSGKWYRQAPQLLLGIANTQRVLLFLRDKFWVGIVEPNGYFRDPLTARQSLVPGNVKSFGANLEDLPLVPRVPTEVFRNGEYYFIPRKDFTVPAGKKIHKWMPIGEEDERPHTARDLVVVDGITYIRGTVRHRTRRMISCRFFVDNKAGVTKLVEPWYEVAKSIQVGSWKGCYYWG